MNTEGVFSCIKILLLLVIIWQLYTFGRQGFEPDIPVSSISNLAYNRAAQAYQLSGDMPTSATSVDRQPFTGEAPVYYPMGDEKYLNKYLYGMDPSALTPAAIAGIQAPIFPRLNAPGTTGYAQYGDKGIHQLTNDILTARNLGAGTCASGQWVGDTSACPEILTQLAPGPESFENWVPNPHT